MEGSGEEEACLRETLAGRSKDACIAQSMPVLYSIRGKSSTEKWEVGRLKLNVPGQEAENFGLLPHSD